MGPHPGSKAPPCRVPWGLRTVPAHLQLSPLQLHLQIHGAPESNLHARSCEREMGRHTGSPGPGFYNSVGEIGQLHENVKTTRDEQERSRPRRGPCQGGQCLWAPLPYKLPINPLRPGPCFSSVPVVSGAVTQAPAASLPGTLQAGPGQALCPGPRGPSDSGACPRLKAVSHKPAARRPSSIGPPLLWEAGVPGTRGVSELEIPIGVGSGRPGRQGLIPHHVPLSLVQQAPIRHPLCTRCGQRPWTWSCGAGPASPGALGGAGRAEPWAEGLVGPGSSLCLWSRVWRGEGEVGDPTGRKQSLNSLDEVSFSCGHQAPGACERASRWTWPM